MNGLHHARMHSPGQVCFEIMNHESTQRDPPRWLSWMSHTGHRSLMTHGHRAAKRCCHCPAHSCACSACAGLPSHLMLLPHPTPASPSAAPAPATADPKQELREGQRQRQRVEASEAMHEVHSSKGHTNHHIIGLGNSGVVDGIRHLQGSTHSAGPSAACLGTWRGGMCPQ